MPRVFVTGDQIAANRITITDGDARHLAVVLRKLPGAKVTAIGPDGTEYRLQLETVTPAAVTGAILGSAKPQREPKTEVTLAQALLKGHRFDWVVEKGTEAGLARLVPFTSARTIVKLPPRRRSERRQRWQRIATAAARQSGRTRVPAVDLLHPFSEVVKLVQQTAAAGGLALLAWEGEQSTGLYEKLAWWQEAATEPPGQLLLIVGPEGGFQQDEVQQLLAAGAASISLGPLIFRADTAGLAFILMVLYHLGDLGRAKT